MDLVGLAGRQWSGWMGRAGDLVPAVVAAASAHSGGVKLAHSELSMLLVESHHMFDDSVRRTSAGRHRSL